MNPIEWREHVKAAQKEVLSIKQSRMRIVEIALKACTIPKAGGERRHAAANNVYTLKRFAEDIGMEPSTLRRWVQVKVNIIDKLKDYSDDEPGAYNAAERTHVALGTKGAKDKEVVRKKFKEVKERIAGPKIQTVSVLERLYAQSKFIRRQVNRADIKSSSDVKLAKSLATILEVTAKEVWDKLQ
jgi:hypothetical protein